MIKLDKHIYDDVKNDYIDYCKSYIENLDDKLIAFISSNDELFNGKTSRRKLFCDNYGIIDYSKIEALLLMDFDEDNLDDNELNNYFKTGLLIYRMRYLIKNLNFKSKNNYQSRNKLIVDNINKYKSDWIIPYFPKNFFDDSDDYLNKNITKKSIIEILDKIEDQYQKITLYTNPKDEEEKHLFDYSWITGIRDKILSSTNISVCPYCNRQFVSSYKKVKGNYKTTATLDHFYPKSKFPLFALSLYNFIPSCHICNEIFKLQDTRKIMYPFKQGYENNAHFRIKEFKDLNALLGKNQNFELFVKVDENQEEIKNSIDLFKTNDIYNCHKGHVQSIINKHHIYSDKYKDMLRSDLKQIGLSYSEAGLNAFLYNLDPDDEEQTNVILGRLTKDILEMIDETENKL